MKPMYPPTLEKLDATYTTHKLFKAADRAALLATIVLVSWLLNRLVLPAAAPGGSPLARLARSNAAHQGRWDKSADDSYEVRGKTLGIIGYGHIGSQVGVLAEAFGITHDELPFRSTALPAEVLAEIAKERGHAVLIVTHDPRLLPFADRVVHIEDGRIIAEERGGIRQTLENH